MRGTILDSKRTLEGMCRTQTFRNPTGESSEKSSTNEQLLLKSAATQFVHSAQPEHGHSAANASHSPPNTVNPLGLEPSRIASRR